MDKAEIPSQQQSKRAPFSPTVMATKLEQLTGTQQSIQTLSLWLIHHRKHSEKIVTVWLQEVTKETRSSRLLCLVYLANDVIQNGRKKWPKFQEQFFSVFEDGFSHIGAHADQKTIAAVTRVLDVWKERSVFASKAVEQLQTALAAGSASSGAKIDLDLNSSTPPQKQEKHHNHHHRRHSSSATNNHDRPTTSGTSGTSSSALLLSHYSPEGTPPRPDALGNKRKRQAEEPLEDEGPVPTTADLLEALKKLEDPPSADEATREQIASFPEAVANSQFLSQISNAEKAESLHRKIKEAQPVVESYTKRLSEEMDLRRRTQELLTNYLRAQKQKALNTQDLLNKFREKCDKMNADRQQVYKHFDSLPDLSRMANIAEMNPLPSLGELFHKH